MNNVDKLKLIADKVSQCQLCQELATTRTNTVFGRGSPNARIVLIGESAGKNEDLQGKPFVGQAGKLLDSILSAAKLSVDGLLGKIGKCSWPN